MIKKERILSDFLHTEPSIAHVEIVQIKGSCPRDQGTWMLVSRKKIFQTIGGGYLEKMVIDKSRQLLLNDQKEEELSVALGQNQSQCCGGQVKIKIKKLIKSDYSQLLNQIKYDVAQLPSIFIFGAGHVGKALSQLLRTMPVKTYLVDDRETFLKDAPKGIEIIHTVLPDEIVRNAPDNSAFIILTYNHSLDFLITLEALKRKTFIFLGMIGSKTKKKKFIQFFQRESGSNQGLEKLVCPIGNPTIKDKRPEIIACQIANQVMTYCSIYTSKQNEA